MFWLCLVAVFKQKTAYEMRIRDWSSDVCSSDLSISPEKRASAGITAADVMSPPVPRSSASVAATKVSRSNRSSAKVMAAKFPGMVGVRDEKRPFDRLGANEVVPGVSLFEQLRHFLQIGRAHV